MGDLMQRFAGDASPESPENQQNQTMTAHVEVSVNFQSPGISKNAQEDG